MSVTRQLMDNIDLQSRRKNTMDVNGVHQLFGYQHSSKNLLMCSAQKRNSYWNNL